MKPIEMEGGTTKKELHIFYVLDTSYSMTGDPIGALNDAMRSTVAELKKLDGDKADLRLAALAFNTECSWVTGGAGNLEFLSDFVWTPLKAEGMTYLGRALRELNASMSRNDKMKSATGNKVPVVIFMSDGYPNDDWREALNELAENKWYQSAIKIAFALGDKADTDALANVVGVRKDGSIVPDYEAVIKTTQLDVFAKMIQVVSVSASLAASTSQLTTKEPTGKDIVEGAAPGAQKDEKGTVVVTAVPSNDPFAVDPTAGGGDITFDDIS